MEAHILNGKKSGHYRGRVAIRRTGSFNITTPTGIVQGTSHRDCCLLKRGAGYEFSNQKISKT